MSVPAHIMYLTLHFELTLEGSSSTFGGHGGLSLRGNAILLLFWIAFKRGYYSHSAMPPRKV